MHASRPTTPLVVIVGLTLVLAACAGTAATPSASETVEPMESHTMAPESMAPESMTPESEAPTDEAEAEEVRVRLESSQFDPEELTIEVGTTVLFLNADSFAHTVTEGTDGQAVDGPVVDRELAGNRTARVTFDEPGTYDITCRIHPSMQMTIVVEG